MDPTYFGLKDKPLFGIYQAPISQSIKPSAILICYPTFQEYIRSHRSIKSLSDKLAKAGCHVFRFDYLCTGDSSGALAEATFDTWTNNITTAVDELRELSGINNISIISLRMGALLSSLSNIKNIENVILWDPVLDGNRYIKELQNMHEVMLDDLDRFPVPRKNVEIEGYTELLGFTLPDLLLNSIKTAKFDNKIIANSRKIHFISSEENKEAKDLSVMLINDNNDVEYHLIEDDGDWLDLTRIEETLIPNKIVNVIVEIFEK